MSMSLTTATEYARDMIERGECDAAEANVEIVKMMGVRLVEGAIPRGVRTALMQAVKAGRIGHIRQDGDRPEAFYHPNGKGNAIAARDRRARELLDAQVKALSATMVHHRDLGVFDDSDQT